MEEGIVAGGGGDVLDSREFVMLLIVVMLFTVFSFGDERFERCAAVLDVLSFSCCSLLVTVNIAFPLVAKNMSLSVKANVMYCTLVTKSLMEGGGLPVMLTVLLYVMLKVVMKTTGNILVNVVGLPPFLTALYAYVVAQNTKSLYDTAP